MDSIAKGHVVLKLERKLVWQAETISMSWAFSDLGSIVAIILTKESRICNWDY